MKTFVSLAISLAVSALFSGPLLGQQVTGGYLRVSPQNPKRLMLADGVTPFYPMLLGGCMYNRSYAGNANTDPKETLDPNNPIVFWIDTVDGVGRPGAKVDPDTFFNAFGTNGGFNLLRFGPSNCALSFAPDYTVVSTDQDYLDQKWNTATRDKYLQAMQSARAHGLRVMFSLIGSSGVVPHSDNPNNLHPYIDFITSTFGQYIDIYDLTNELSPSNSWINDIASYVRSRDPGKLITISWERADLPSIDIVQPHWYLTDNELNTDSTAYSRWPNYGKPLILGEGGEADAGVNWDSSTPNRVRLRSWAAFFGEWAAGWYVADWMKGPCAGSPSACNIWIGPQERGYLKSLADFVTNLPVTVTPTVPTVSSPLRAYALTGSDIYVAYLTNSKNHATPTGGAKLTITPQFSFGSGRWVNPSTGAVISTFNFSGTGSQTLAVPSFTTDVALRIDPSPSPTTVTISGTVSLPNKTAVSDVLITPSSGNAVLTNASGAYSVTVPYGFTGNLTPTKTGYTFSPSLRSYTNITSNSTGQNFTAK